MSAPTPCYRHRTWLVHCDDCTAWHLARAITARDDTARRTVSAPALTLVPTGGRRLVVVPIAA
jgi:hypothetical protein